MSVISIDKQGEVFYCAFFKRKKKEAILTALKTKKMGGGTSSLSEEYPFLVTGVKSQDVLIRHIETPLKNMRMQRKCLPFQLEGIIPHPIDDVIVKSIDMKAEKENHKTCFIVSKKRLEGHLTEWQEYDPDWVSCTPIALFRFGSFVGVTETAYIIFHMGQKETQIVSIAEGLVHTCLTIEIGAEHFCKAFSRDSSQEKKRNSQDENSCDLRKVAEEKFPHLAEVKRKFYQEIDRAFCFLFRSEKEKKERKVLLTGQIDVFQIDKWLMGTEAFLLSPLKVQKPLGFDLPELRVHAISIGLGLDALKNDRMSMQLRQGIFTPQKRIKELKKSLRKGGLICILLTCVTLFCSLATLHVKEQLLHQKIDRYIERYGDELSAFKTVELTEKIDRKIQILNGNLKFSKNNYKYFVPPPCVSDCLAFLATHPKLREQGRDKEIKIKGLWYVLTEYPSIDKPYSPYKIRVDVIFETANSHYIKEFYDAIASGDKCIDTDGEVTWKQNERMHEISFFFKS